ncbi:hypothetical protein BDZ45DRAFT_141974 [Acephala macrosclerotiorum]|nr:hypothetical protein BDZ45DRAFT_141974 [Acephala macrosclerotiorum]
MSGVEIAGFVLAAFPVLISAGEHDREGFEPLVKWKKFRTEFISFINRVDIEKQLFDDMLAAFLISADVPEEEIQKFLTMQNYEGWQRQDLVRTLEKRLGSSYKVYMSEIKTMNKLMEELAEILSLKNGDFDWAADGASRWDYQLKRLRISFSKRGDKTISQLEVHNKKLRELLDSKNKLDTMKASRKDTTLGTLFERIRGHAASLHAALKQSWNCGCTKPHVAGLQLQQREFSEEPDSEFFLAFNVSKEPSQTAIRRREVIISLRKTIEMEAPAQTRPSVSHKMNLSNGDIGTLRHNFEHSKSDPLIHKVTRRKLFSSSLTTSAGTHASSLRGMFSKSDLGNGCPESCESPNNSNSSLLSGETLPSKTEWHRKTVAMTKKSVRIDISVAVKALESTQMQLSALKIVEPEEESGAEIKDLCSEICKSKEGMCHGYLVDDKQRHHIVRAMILEEDQEDISQINVATESEYINLETLLQVRSEWRLTRRQRFRVACILASSVLQLQSTPWLAEKMQKKSVLFYRQGDKILADRPYIRHAFASAKAETAPTDSHTSADPASSDSIAKKTLPSESATSTQNHSRHSLQP